MSLELDLRWRHIWWFLSLDCVRFFSRPLWAPIDLQLIQKKLRENINVIAAEGLYHRAPGAVHSCVQKWILNELTVEQIVSLPLWAQNVFIDGGEDRSAEFIWRLIVARVANEKYTVPDWFKKLSTAVLDSCNRDAQSREPQIQRQLETANLSAWDNTAIALEAAATPDSLKEKIGLIADLNSFAKAWDSLCKNSGDELTSIHNLVQQLVQDEMPELQLSFPGNWNMQLLSFLRQRRA